MHWLFLKNSRKIKYSMISLKKGLRDFWIYTPVPVQWVSPRRNSGKFWISVDSLWKFGVCIFKTPRRRVRAGRGKFEPFWVFFETSSEACSCSYGFEKIEQARETGAGPVTCIPLNNQLIDYQFRLRKVNNPQVLKFTKTKLERSTNEGCQMRS